MFVLRAHGVLQEKRGAADLLRRFGAAGAHIAPEVQQKMRERAVHGA